MERPAADGDIVTINLVASRDSEPLDDATASDVEHTIGSGQMLDGLDEAVTGLSAGESATFASKLVSGPLKDEEADIQVTVTKVEASELPDADDEFAQEASSSTRSRSSREHRGSTHSNSPTRAGQSGPRRRIGKPGRTG